MDQDALAGPEVGHLEEHHVGGEVVHGQRRRLLEAHGVGHEEGLVSRHHHQLLPQATAAQHDDPVTGLRWEGEEGREVRGKRSGEGRGGMDVGGRGVRGGR